MGARNGLGSGLRLPHCLLDLDLVFGVRRRRRRRRPAVRPTRIASTRRVAMWSWRRRPWPRTAGARSSATSASSFPTTASTTTRSSSPPTFALSLPARSRVRSRSRPRPPARLQAHFPYARQPRGSASAHAWRRLSGGAAAAQISSACVLDTQVMTLRVCGHELASREGLAGRRRLPQAASADAGDAPVPDAGGGKYHFEVCEWSIACFPHSHRLECMLHHAWLAHVTAAGKALDGPSPPTPLPPTGASRCAPSRLV